MSKYSGLKFEKFDLHVHTPASHDFKDKSITPEQIVEKALEIGLKGIAITDHNTGHLIDPIKDAAKGTGLVIFPGVEIYCTGGKNGIHIIGLFDIDKGTKHINGVLAKLDFNPDDIGTDKAVTSKSSYDVIDVITSNPYNGIAVLAHCTSSKGVLHDITGLTRTKIFEHMGLLAVESSTTDFTDQIKIEKKTRAIDLLNGNDTNYFERKLGVYIASDSRIPGIEEHSINAIGSQFTYFKVDEEISLESLRQCFIDREVRIRQHFEYKENLYPSISNISILGGFFDGQNAIFHQGLNSILGAKGAGKSLLVELMRFVLGQESPNPEILEDHNRKLEKKLNTYGTVKLEFVDETGTSQSIERVFNPSTNNPYKGSSDSNLAASFPVLFLSQNEIIRIAENESEQIKFIDRFFDFQTFHNRIKIIENDLSDLDRQFSTGMKAISALKEVKSQIDKNNFELSKLNKIFQDPIYNNYNKLEAKDFALRKQKELLKDLKSESEDFFENIKSFESPAFTSPLSEDPTIMRNSDSIKSLKNKLLAQYTNSLQEIDNVIQKVAQEYSTWEKSFLKEKEKYEKHIRDAGGDKKELERKRLRIVKDIEDLQKRESNLSSESTDLKKIKEKRDEQIEKLFSVYNEYSDERKQKCSKFERDSLGKLKIQIHESTNTDAFKKELGSLKTGSYLRDSEINEICEKISPYDFILELLRYDASKDISRLEPIASNVNIEIERIKLLCDFLLSQVEYEKLLQLQYKAYPQDRPEIKYRLIDGSYELIRDISIGQKCTAMLIMALSDGNFPIVIDQPEDSLDVRSVWEDMCVKIRAGKTKRQFVFTTHNSSLAVASDTDKFLIIEGNAQNASIQYSGAIEIKDIKEEVMKYLEGGRPTYRKKANKYGM